MTGLALMCVLAAVAVLAPSASAAGSAGAAAWGSNSSGQLGDGTMNGSLEPAPITDLTGISAIAGGKSHALALLASGKVMAWGENASGELGDATTTSSEVPVEVKGITDAVAIAAGGEFSLALLATGTVVAWGQNAEGQLGDGNITSSDVPVAVKGLTEVTAIAAGSKHALALLKDGDVEAWGADSAGQLGNGTTTTGEVEPVAVSELSGVEAIAAGGLSSYAVLSGGSAKSWGANGKGQLGNGTTTGSDVPVEVQGLIGASAIAASENHALAVTSTGTVFGWGNGASGELGNGADTSSDQAVQVMEVSEASGVAAGTNSSLAVLSTGKVLAWGGNGEGQLGDGATAATDEPVTLTGIDEVKAIAAGGLSSYAVGPKLPTATAVAPTSGPAGGHTAVTITGTGFKDVSAVRFGATGATEYTVESETTIHATSPAGTGIVNVTVTIPGGTSPATSANRFSYSPVVSSLSPSGGPQTGDTEVVITGANLAGVNGVSFGANAAESFKDESSTKVIAFSPAGVGTVNVTLTGPGGASETVEADRFTYTSSAPEIGRCLKAGGKHGKGSAKGQYADRGCLAASTEGHFEWLPGAGSRPTFKLKGRSFQLATAGGSNVACKAAKGSGEYAGAKSLAGIVMTLTGCASGHAKCESEGSAKEGEIVSAELAGTFGVIKAEAQQSEDELGLDLSAVGAGALLDFKCAGTSHVWRGSVIAPVRANKMEKTVTLAFVVAGGHQKVERFEGKTLDVLESSTGDAAYEQGTLATTVLLRGREAIEVNAGH